METAELSERQIRKAQKLIQSASRIECYILERLDQWYRFRESLLASVEMRVLNMHEDIDGTPTDWRKIILIFNEPQMENFPILCIYPPKEGTNCKHDVTIELMDKNRSLSPENLYWFGLFRSKITECGIKFHCKERLTYSDEEGYRIQLDFGTKLKMSFEKLVYFLEQLNATLDEAGIVEVK